MPPKFSLDIGDFDTEASVSMTWSIDPSGTMRHKKTGTKISPNEGIAYGGHEYRLSPDDIEYEEQTLGSGACGVVRKGTIKKTGEQVALKTIKVDEKLKREQLLNEIRGLVQAEGCPHLVQWYAGFVDKKGSSVHVALEFMDLGSLADLKKRLGGNGVPPNYLACIAQQVISGLHYLHGKHLLHRDLKPENILHNTKGEVKLTDFGIARDLDTTFAMAGTFVGTVTYMSPERCMGEDYSFLSDIWSVGMVFYELATGRYPFHDVTSFPALLDSLCEQPEPRLSEGSEHMRDFVAQCLTRDVRQRPDTTMLLEHPFLTQDVASVSEFAAFLGALSA